MPGDFVTERRQIRDKAGINELIREAQEDIANGRVMPLPPLAEFLTSVREQHSAAVQDQQQADKK